MRTGFTKRMLALRAKLDASCLARHAFVMKLRERVWEERVELREDLSGAAAAWAARSCEG
jgi:hypothetical protein